MFQLFFLNLSLTLLLYTNNVLNENTELLNIYKKKKIEYKEHDLKANKTFAP